MYNVVDINLYDDIYHNFLFNTLSYMNLYL